jgi:hypothetical protein
MRRLFLIAAFIAMAASACVGDEKIVMPTTLVWELGDETFVMRAMKCDKILHLKATGSNGTVFRFVRLPKENWKHIQMEEPLRLEYMCNMLQFFNSIITERYCRYNEGVYSQARKSIDMHYHAVKLVKTGALVVAVQVPTSRQAARYVARITTSW